jgi:hypothetical protein
MRFREIFIISRGTKVIFSITFSVSVLAVIFACFYYRDINRSEDPRLKKAREFLLQYEKESGRNNSLEAFPFLDSANAIFMSYPDYEFSFEIGVIYNNKCSALLLMALYDSIIGESEKNNLLSLAMKYCDSSISNYSAWITSWDSLPPEIIADRISPYMKKDDPAFSGYDFEKIFSRRIKNIVAAQIETPRRLSVSLSNKGTIYRHMMKPDSSLICYQLALSLWEDNRTAKSNLNVLMGGEPIQPSLIESLFPPDKNKK